MNGATSIRVPGQEGSLGTTESLCPVCLERLPARRTAEGDDVYLEKLCPEHGAFRTIIWRGPPSFPSWVGPAKQPSRPPSSTDSARGCPFDCGLCPGHRQHTCCVLLEVTRRCNLACPFCFAASCEEDSDPDRTVIEGWYRSLLTRGGPYNIQLSGGEPTVREDLPDLIALGRSLGYDFIQLNTNGIRLAEDVRYVKSLKEAGLGCVFLQFDGTSDAVYERMRGAALLESKTAAIAHCAEQHLGVILVPTVVPGVNSEDLGKIIEYAVQRAPAVRGVHFQPISYFGRYPRPPSDSDRITLPEVMNGIERQTGGRIKASQLRPPSAENAHCSFQAHFVLGPDGEFRQPMCPTGSGCCAVKVSERGGEADRGAQAGCCPPRVVAEEASRARQHVARRWTFPGGDGPRGAEPDGATRIDSLDAFLEQVERGSFCISGMAFQDVWNVDLERLRDCFLHVAGDGGRVIPFCAHNLTDAQGRPLHRPGA